MRHLNRPRHATVVAYLALFLALGGSAYAVTSLPANSVGSSQIRDNAVLSRHIKDGAVKNQDLAANSVGSGKVINGSLLRPDFKAGELPPGAISIPITNVAGTGTLRTINGIDIAYSCNGGTGPYAVSVEVGAYSPGIVYMSGIKAEDSVLSAVNTHTGPVSFYSASGSSTASLDVIASADGTTWNRIDLGGYNGNTSCNVWGLVIPGK
jgi:hypothetical protein